MHNLRHYVILVCSLIACVAGISAIISDGPRSPGAAALVIGGTGFGFCVAGWFKNGNMSQSEADKSEST